MCNLSQGVLERGIEKGLAQGLAQGHAQGHAQGLEQGLAQGIGQGVDRARIESIRALMSSTGWTLEEAVRALNYPLSEMEKYAAALNEGTAV